MLNKTGILNGSLEYMKYLQKGLAVHTDNLSRMDMPGEQAYEMKSFAEQLKNSSPSQIHVTSAMHMSSKGSNGLGSSVQKVKSDDISPSGNNISQEEQMSKINDLTTEIVKAQRLYQKGLSFLRLFTNSKT